MTSPLIAVIDDDANNVWALSLVLRDMGYRTITGLSETEILHEIDSSDQVPDALVTDYHLGNKDGIAAAQIVIQRVGKNIPVVIVTGSSSASETLRQEATGYGVLTKPIDPDRLVEYLPSISRGH